jgi:serine/threonine protein kinase
MDSTIKIPGYRIESKIGEGGMATVYLASQEALERTVALKIMAPTTLADPSAEKRFLKEGKIIAGLSPIPVNEFPTPLKKNSKNNTIKHQ